MVGVPRVHFYTMSVNVRKKSGAFHLSIYLDKKEKICTSLIDFLAEAFMTGLPLTSLTFIMIVRSTPLTFITSERFDVYYEYIFYNVNVNYECTFYNVYIYNLYYEYNFVLQR